MGLRLRVPHLFKVGRGKVRRWSMPHCRTTTPYGVWGAVRHGRPSECEVRQCGTYGRCETSSLESLR
jgi:hypothetical protein